MLSWLDVRPFVLDEIISLDGPGNVQMDLCGLCLNRKTTPLHRCLECSYGLLFCGECAVRSHQALPLHRLEVRSPNTLLHHAHAICSVGRMVFSTGHLCIPSDPSIISSTEAPPAPWHRPPTILLLSTLTAGTNYVSDSAVVMWILHGLSIIINCYECAGTQHLSTALEPCSPSTFLKHTTK